jgi:hypothetical protein
MFLALLVPKQFGPVIVPRDFAQDYAGALSRAIYPFGVPDYRYATGLIDDQRLRSNVETLIEALPDIQRHPDWYFTTSGSGLMLRLCEMARDRNTYFSMFYPEYGPIKDRFSECFPAKLEEITAAAGRAGASLR